MAVKKTAAKKKPAAKKTTVKKAAAKAPAAKKPVAKKKVVAKKATAVKAKPLTAIKDPMTKSQILTTIAESTELTKKQVTAVFDELSNLMERHLKKRGAGSFTLPGLLKCEVKTKPAKKARKGVNPFTGEEMMFKAKPASKVVKVRPLKKVKEMAE